MPYPSYQLDGFLLLLDFLLPFLLVLAFIYTAGTISKVSISRLFFHQVGFVFGGGGVRCTAEKFTKSTTFAVICPLVYTLIYLVVFLQ